MTSDDHAVSNALILETNLSESSSNASVMCHSWLGGDALGITYFGTPLSGFDNAVRYETATNEFLRSSRDRLGMY